MLRAFMQSDCLYYFYTLPYILGTLQRHIECSDVTVLVHFEGVCMPQHIRAVPGLDHGWTQRPKLWK